MPRKPQPAALDGALIIDKPQGKTSHDVVNAARRILGFRQIGHLGTLDPLATGVLVLLLGRATRLAQFYVGRRKRYTSTFRFGFATDTYDANGAPAGPDTAPKLDRSEIERLAAARIGCFPQMPPPYSAKKIHGRPAHELARKKQPVELKAVDIEIYDFCVNEVSGSLANFSIECASGTYIRSLAHDMGAALGCGAHCAEIIRTAVGEFTLDQAVKLEDLEHAAAAGDLARYVIPLERLLPELPSVTVLPQQEQRVRHGSKFNVQIAQIQPGRTSSAQGATAELNSGEWKPARLRVLSQQDRLIAIAEPIVPRTYQPVIVLEAEA
ncbi:MAG TPA: tRNA pseudouridine(55) synthase TruB [Candidatus Dormibacteraeota bacterium]|nr:tRNA pseudouridine(55) synthase TruB [Candidatus Dormibacteraeota bacterium]